MRSPIFDHLSLVYLPSGVYPRNVYHNRSLCSVRKFRAPREHFTNSRTRLNALSVRSIINDTLDSMLCFLASFCFYRFTSSHYVIPRILNSFILSFHTLVLVSIVISPPRTLYSHLPRALCGSPFYLALYRPSQWNQIPHCTRSIPLASFMGLGIGPILLC